MTNNALVAVAQKLGGRALPDNSQWENRVEIKSETSNKLYVVSTHKTNGTVGCSCPGWLRYKHCKHVRVFAPALEAVKRENLRGR